MRAGAGGKGVLGKERLIGFLGACEDPVVRVFLEGVVQEGYFKVV